MRALALALITSLGLTAAAAAQEARNAEIESVISGQIEAFVADDVATAFTFASPNIQGLFGSSDRFGVMVQQGYPMVWRPGDVSFLELKEVAPYQLQRVLIVDRAGVPHVLEYQMIPSENGWKINGVSLLRAPAVGA
ncbi:MAG: DUF4864 domain-containing protein [Alphaproteobacteria bacterium]|nr:DUF4864 domain-containing protein [Alphaproteobacteria bacterium]NNF25452.1 DUF4864 domain-containing protein [Paracoccaceae bacterium]